MAQWHLDSIHGEFVRKGWKVTPVPPPELGYRICDSWEVRRGDKVYAIDFDDKDPMGYNVPLDQCYGCEVVGLKAKGLYFPSHARNRKKWAQEVTAFVAQLDKIVDLVDSKKE